MVSRLTIASSAANTTTVSTGTTFPGDTTQLNRNSPDKPLEFAVNRPVYIGIAASQAPPSLINGWLLFLR